MANEKNKKQASNAAAVKQANAQKKSSSADERMPLDKINFILMAASLALVVIGFLLMCGGANTGDTFNTDIFSTRRIVVAPIVVLAGFLLMIPAIMYRKKDKKIEEKVDEEVTKPVENKE